MTRTLEESVVMVMVMDGASTDMFPFLPYILQDFWEMGASPANMITLIEKHMSNFSELKVLDLGCGKGAVSVRVAKKLKCHCFGIDAIKEFVAEAKEKAKEHGVERYCEFEAGDIRERIKELPEYDVIILGAIGPIFGTYYETMITLLPHLKLNGIVIVDDAYIDDNSTFTHPLIAKYSDLIAQLDRAGAVLFDEIKETGSDELLRGHDREFSYLQQRCSELIAKYPDKKELFENYLSNQKEEYSIMENDVVCPTMVIKRKNKL